MVNAFLWATGTRWWTAHVKTNGVLRLLQEKTRAANSMQYKIKNWVTKQQNICYSIGTQSVLQQNVFSDNRDSQELGNCSYHRIYFIKGKHFRLFVCLLATQLKWLLLLNWFAANRKYIVRFKDFFIVSRASIDSSFVDRADRGNQKNKGLLTYCLHVCVGVRKG